MFEFGLKGKNLIIEAMYTNDGSKVHHKTGTVIDASKFNF